MQLSMYVSYALHQGFETPTEAFRHFYDRGVRYADVVDNEFHALPLPQYADSIREAGLQLGSVVSLRDIAHADAAIRNQNMAAVKREIDQMEKLQIPRLMPAPDVVHARSQDEFDRIRERMIAGLAELVDYARGSGIHVMIENQSIRVRPDSRMADLRYILDAVPTLGFVLDTGNFYCVGEDVRKAYTVLGDRMTYIHGKDWIPDPYGPFVRENLPRFNGTAIGDGILPLRELFARLRADESPVPVVLEINAMPITLAMLERSADFLRAQIG